MNGKQLKNSILQWAIQGKLVPQDPNDEPASVLLERIRAEKARLVKEGRIKKDKNESIIFRGEDNSHYEKFPDGTVKCIDEEIPFEIPQGWVWARIFHVFSLQAGKNIKASEISVEQTETHPYPCFGGNGLRGYVGYFNNEGEKPLIGRQGALCGNLNMSYGHFFATEHAVVVDCFASVKVRWAYYTLMALNLNQYATATAQPGLAVSNIIKVFIPVPPIEEQCRIINTIDKLTPEIEAFNEKETRLNELNVGIRYALRKSILQEAIQGRLVTQESDEEPASVLLRRIRIEKQKLLKEGKIKRKDIVDSVIFKGEDNKYYEKVGGRVIDISEELPIDIPSSWAWCRLGSVIILQSGQDLVPERYSDISKGIPYITGASNLANGAVLVNRWTNTPTSISHKGDLLITCKGTVGAMAYNTIGDIHIARQIMSIHSEWILIDYVEKYLEYSIPKLEKAAHSIIPGISRETILSTLIPIPPLEEQSRIIGRLREIHKYFRG
ncbi:MAG: restriction endonuclease subunit S [Bacteroidales bacterium]|nr:restriction endonuclease subunit S [Bacteroidales bacterium]